MNLPRSRILKTAKRIRVPATKQIRTIQPELLTAIAVARVAGAIVGIGRGVGVVMGGSAPIQKFYITVWLLENIFCKKLLSCQFKSVLKQLCNIKREQNLLLYDEANFCYRCIFLQPLPSPWCRRRCGWGPPPCSGRCRPQSVCSHHCRNMDLKPVKTFCTHFFK